MNVSYRWLQKLAPTIVGPALAVAERLTGIAVAVDEVIWLGSGLQDIVIGQVEEIASHPNADRLVVCQVNVGGKSTAQVVTGAPKVTQGAFYPFVGVGGTLPGGLSIKRAKLRGEYSEGMLCSERELNLGRDQEGIMQLYGDFVPGTAFIEALGLDDHRLVLDITPNRSDLLGHFGVARELAPGGGADLVRPDFPGHATVEVELLRSELEAETGGVRISIEDTEGCSRFTGVVIRGVTVKPSPEWLARDLRAAGLQPLNNVVDATNHVLYELNQPIHAYDLATLRGPEIIVRRAKAGEKLQTLDGKERKLNPDMLVIADAGGAIGLAGVMGGLATEVAGGTSDVLIEAAYFDPGRNRTGARALGMDTDASYRFQRGIDPQATHEAMARVVNLILAVAGGTVEGAGVDLNPRPTERLVVSVRHSRVTHVLGVELEPESIPSYLEPIGFETRQAKNGTFDVAVPGWRPDVEREIDLIEEIARRHGYDKFPDKLGLFRPTTIPEEEYADVFERLRDFFVGAGFLESRGSPLGPAEEGEVQVLNPLSEVESHLRSSLLTSLLHSVERNFAQAQRDVRLFELGTAFKAGAGLVPDERLHVAAAWTGAREPAHWSSEGGGGGGGGGGGDYDVWDLKWLVESVAAIAARGTELRPVDGDGDEPWLEDAFAVMSGDGQPLGLAGRVPNDRVEAPRWAAKVWGLEVEIVSRRAAQVTYRDLPVYPPSDRDLALVVPTRVLAAEVAGVIRKAAPDFLDDVSIFDVYEGESIPAGTRSIAWRLRFRAADRTLTDAEIDAAVKSIASALKRDLNVGIRGA
ncbi:MAG: phenylalanine--tRNA ligase subunit beta [Gemmatimonadota bacterium]